MVTAFSGISESVSTKRAPLALRLSTTCLLCTISWRTYTGAPYFCSARSTISMARTTPAQKPRGCARTIRMGNFWIIGFSARSGRSCEAEPECFRTNASAERAENFCDDACGIKPGLGIHRRRAVLIETRVRQHHRTDFETAIEHAVVGQFAIGISQRPGNAPAGCRQRIEPG